jgi:hypothetical protein
MTSLGPGAGPKGGGLDIGPTWPFAAWSGHVGPPTLLCALLENIFTALYRVYS